jgi:hypothetical protein
MATRELTDAESRDLARATMRFAALTVVTALAVTLRYHLLWWQIVGIVIGVWFLTIFGAGLISAYRPFRPE